MFRSRCYSSGSTREQATEPEPAETAETAETAADQTTQQQAPNQAAREVTAMAWMTASDVAERLGCSPETVLRLARQRRISHLRVGRFVRFSEQDVAEFEQAHHVARADPEPRPMYGLSPRSRHRHRLAT